jgi:hypothetical protein
MDVIPAKPVPAYEGSGYPIFKTTFYDFIKIDGFVKNPGVSPITVTFFLYNKFKLLSCRVPALNRVRVIHVLNACPIVFDLDVYQPRNPRASAYNVSFSIRPAVF